MNILIDIGHPAQVHFFKHIILGLKNEGHSVKVTLRNNDCAGDLLDYYGIEYELISSSNKKGVVKKIFGMIEIDLKLLKVAKKFGPDVLISETGYVSHIGKLLKKPSVLVHQNEHATLENIAFLPFADIIITFSSYYGKKWWKNGITLDGYFFLPYLHPDYFIPERNVLKELGVSDREEYVILRFSSWSAAHDIGQSGMTQKQMIKIVRELSKTYRVFISSEEELPIELIGNKLSIGPESYHSALNYASMYIGEGGSSAAEAAILGVPSLFFSSIRCGYLDELRNRYKLVYTTHNIEECWEFIKMIQSNDGVRESWREKRNRMIAEKCDVVKEFIDIIKRFEN